MAMIDVDDEAPCWAVDDAAPGRGDREPEAAKRMMTRARSR
jgi:hypothetical protein